MKDTARNGGGLLLCGKTLLGLGEMEGRQGGSETLAPFPLLLGRDAINGVGEESAGPEGPAAVSGSLTQHPGRKEQCPRPPGLLTQGEEYVESQRG